MNPRLAKVARWVIALVAVGLLVSLVDLGSIGTRLAGTDLRLAIPAVIGLVVVHVVPAAAWRRLLHELAGVSLEWGRTLRLYYAAQVLGTVTPANVGADVYRVLAIGGDPGRAQLAQPVLVQRLTSVIALACLGVVGGVLLPIAGLGPFLLLAAVIGTVLAVLTVAFLGSARDGGWVGRIGRRLGWTGAAATGRERLRSAVRDGLGLGLIFHGISLVLGLVLVLSVDGQASARAWPVLGALAVARLSLAVPISPNGLGIQEGLLALLFVQLGLPADAAVAAALLNRLGFLLTAAVGAALLLSPSQTGGAPIARSTRPSRPSVGG